MRAEYGLLWVVSGGTESRVQLSKCPFTRMVFCNLVYGAFPCCITTQSRRAEIVAVEVGFRVLRRRMIAFEDELAILERCRAQQTSMYYSDDQILEAMGYSSDLQQRQGVKTS